MPHLLGAYAAKQCPYRLYRQYDPTEPAVAAPPDDALQLLFDDGIQFEADIVAAILDLHGDAAVAIPGRDEPDHDLRRRLTDDALAAGTPIILGALMRPDVDGRRMGEIDILLATGTTTGAGKMIYRPIDVKAHKSTNTMKDPSAIPDGLVHDLRLLPDATGTLHVAPGVEPRYREDDCLQLAHYYRLLRTNGHAVGFEKEEPVLAGILGSEKLVAWFDLNAPKFNTLTPQEQTADDGTTEIVFHRRSRSKKRTALNRYNFEFGFRLRVVDAAEARTSRDEPSLVLPVSVSECKRCPWHDPCETDLEAIDDVSLVSSVGYADWRVHRFMGVHTTRQLAELDVAEAVLVYASTPLTSKTLVAQIQNARARLAGGLMIAPDWDPAEIPRGDIEIDLDLENADTVYLWGARLARVPDHWPETAESYTAFASFEELDAEGEAELVVQLWAWLDDIRHRASDEGLTVRVYGYSMAGTEGAHLRRICADGAAADLPSTADVDDLIGSDQWVDLHPYMKRKYWSNHGHGLKVVAVAAGFAWRDDDPGGYASIAWHRDAVAGVDRDLNIARLLAYNEDDCAATAALR